MNRWSAAVAAGIVSLGLLTGCAAQLPASPGLGGSDGGQDAPVGEYVGIADPTSDDASDGAATDDGQDLGIVPWAKPHGFRITFDAGALPRGTSATLRIIDFNCMAEAINGAIDLSVPKQFLAELDQGTTCWFGTRSTSWITWELKVTLPGGATKSSTFELDFSHKGGDTSTKCWGESGLSCTQVGTSTYVREGDWSVDYFTQTLKLT